MLEPWLVLSTDFQSHRRRTLPVSGAYLGVLASLEEWCDANKSDLIVPHDNVSAVVLIVRNNEGVLKDCDGMLA